MLKHVNNENFKSEVLDNTRAVLVDFFATWCAPCSMLTPVLEKISSSRAAFDIAKVNIDENQELASEYKVEVIPTIIVFKEGKQVERMVGFADENKIVDLMSKYAE